MTETIDHETGEITVTSGHPRMPPEIAAAIIRVMKAAKQLGFDERNEHGKYGYVSIDKFLSALGPLLADAGLLLMIDEVGSDVRAGDSGKGWLFSQYEVWLVHESGTMWGPLRRHLALPVTGPQTFGAAESYIQKRLFRGLFMVATGERDADDVAPEATAPPARPDARGAPISTRAAVEARLNSQSLPRAEAGADPRSAQETADDAAGTINALSGLTVALGLGAEDGDDGEAAARIAYARIRGEIDAAGTIDILNRTGVFSLGSNADRVMIDAVAPGVWQKLVDRDARRRRVLAKNYEVF